MAIFQSGKAKRPVLSEGIDSVIGKRARFKGEISSSGSINITGTFEGKLAADGEVIVSQGGKVEGEITGGQVSVSGEVDGNITAGETLEICKSGRVHGDLFGGKIVIEEGSSYQGKVRVHSAADNPPAAIEPEAQATPTGPAAV